MEYMLAVQGGYPLHGSVKIKGSKNAGLPIIAASLLMDEPVLIEEVPNLSDVRTMIEVIRSLGSEVSYNSSAENLRVSSHSLEPAVLPAPLMQKMRASFLALGPLLARFGHARLALPGGCAIGSRPVDLHLKGLEALGANFTTSNGMIEGRADRLTGAEIYLDYPSVGATENLIMAAALAKGTTIIENAATEPEIVDLAGFLNSAGARVRGAGTRRIRINGVSQLGGTRYAVIPDRIEAGTFMLVAAVTGGSIRVENVLADHLTPLVAKLREAGINVEETADSCLLVEGKAQPLAVDLKTQPYPGFPTDLQPQFSVLVACASGSGIISEHVFDNRFKHISGLTRMGANIQVEGNCAIIKGVESLSGASLEAQDLRGAAALVLAALSARGESRITGLEHLWRGYSKLEERLISLGAKISLVEDNYNRGRSLPGID